jgi:hypothetical protein
MHHILGQNPLPFDPNSMQVSSSIQHQQKQYNTGGISGPMMSDNNNFLSSSHHHHQQQQQQHLASYNHHHHHHHHSLQQYCPPPPPPPPSIQQQFNNYHYMNTYSQDTSNVYNPETQQIHFPNHHFDTQQTYSSYDSNNNFGDQQQYGLLRPVIESELYSSYYSNDIEQSSTANENLLHNLNNNNNSSTNTNTPHYTDLTAISNNGKHYDFVGTNEIDNNHNKDDDQSTLPISNENNFHWNQTTCLATQW